MIVVRMRIAGHSRAEIKQAIREGTPRSRPLDPRAGHRWDHYAKRTLNSAFTLRLTARFEELSRVTHGSG
jgi:hypothetical protein